MKGFLGIIRGTQLYKEKKERKKNIEPISATQINQVEENTVDTITQIIHATPIIKVPEPKRVTDMDALFKSSIHDKTQVEDDEMSTNTTLNQETSNVPHAEYKDTYHQSNNSHHVSIETTLIPAAITRMKRRSTPYNYDTSITDESSKQSTEVLLDTMLDELEPKIDKATITDIYQLTESPLQINESIHNESIHNEPLYSTTQPSPQPKWHQPTDVHPSYSPDMTAQQKIPSSQNTYSDDSTESVHHKELPYDHILLQLKRQVEEMQKIQSTDRKQWQLKEKELLACQNEMKDKIKKTEEQLLKALRMKQMAAQQNHSMHPPQAVILTRSKSEELLSTQSPRQRTPIKPKEPTPKPKAPTPRIRQTVQEPTEDIGYEDRRLEDEVYRVREQRRQIRARNARSVFYPEDYDLHVEAGPIYYNPEKAIMRQRMTDYDDSGYEYALPIAPVRRRVRSNSSSAAHYSREIYVDEADYLRCSPSIITPVPKHKALVKKTRMPELHGRSLYPPPGPPLINSVAAIEDVQYPRYTVARDSLYDPNNGYPTNRMQEYFWYDHPYPIKPRPRRVMKHAYYH